MDRTANVDLDKQTWLGRCPTDRLAIAELIGATTTKGGLKVESRAPTLAPTRRDIKVRYLVEGAQINRNIFHPDWKSGTSANVNVEIDFGRSFRGQTSQ